MIGIFNTINKKIEKQLENDYFAIELECVRKIYIQALKMKNYIFVMNNLIIGFIAK